ncbi:hypothetical protein HHK36_029643 [Tetracentron sinense]|uniref:GH16 domain-containing protein n=1 Tax=Tetracentron sinense TaxID=13715 RepID=A0A834YBN4_TETSI|nr:hypothetical protein HHK36_029643 [Tetracentron sinense]
MAATLQNSSLEVALKRNADPKLNGKYSVETLDLTLKLALPCTALKHRARQAHGLLIFCMTVVSSSQHGHYMPPNVTRLTDLFHHLTFNDGFSEYFGSSNIHLIDNGSYVDLVLDKSSGSGFVSQDKYCYGFFSAAIKLPLGYSSGVVVAFYLIYSHKTYTCMHGTKRITCMHQSYRSRCASSDRIGKIQMSNADLFPHTHDEIDFELLGHQKGKDWVLQTNIYSNGSVSTGRGEISSLVRPNRTVSSIQHHLE